MRTYEAGRRFSELKVEFRIPPDRPVPNYAPSWNVAPTDNVRRVSPTRKWSWLKAWGMRVAQRRGMRRAIVAVARRLAVVLHRMWVDGSEFRWSKDSAAAPTVA